jgi:hypothetical protein
MSTIADKQIKTQVRAAVLTEMQAAVDKLNQAKDAIRNYCEALGRRAPGGYNFTCEVRVNKKGELIIADCRTRNKVELERVLSGASYYEQVLENMRQQDADEQEINRIEQEIIRVVGREKFEWYQQKTNPHWMDV